MKADLSGNLWRMIRKHESRRERRISDTGFAVLYDDNGSVLHVQREGEPTNRDAVMTLLSLIGFHAYAGIDVFTEAYADGVRKTLEIMESHGTNVTADVVSP